MTLETKSTVEMRKKECFRQVVAGDSLATSLQSELENSAGRGVSMLAAVTREMQGSSSASKPGVGTRSSSLGPCPGGGTHTACLQTEGCPRARVSLSVPN